MRLLAAVLAAVLTLTACGPDLLEDAELREAAVPAIEEAAWYRDGVEIPNVKPIASQEADLCSVYSTPTIGWDGDPRWRCAAYAIGVFEWQTDDLEALEETLTEALIEAGDGELTTAMSFGWMTLQRDDKHIARMEGDIVPGVSFRVAAGYDTVMFSDVFPPSGKDERLFSTSGDDILTVPTMEVDPVTCECLQVWVVVYVRYGSVPL